MGVTKGDRVVLYLPMIPEAAYAMLACARIGAIHSIVFGGFSPDALANRINDSEAKIVITADFAPRGGKKTPLKDNTDKALLHCSDRVKCLVVKHTGDQTSWVEGRDFRPQAEMACGQALLPLCRDGRRRPAVHPVYLGLARASRRGWCIPRAAIWSMRDDASDDLRLP
jgi:acetyl-CoA synthetase